MDWPKPWSPARALQGYYALITLAALGSTCVPFLRRWAAFGKLHHHPAAAREPAAHWLTDLLDVRVPKRRFLHFYALGCATCASAVAVSARAGGACHALPRLLGTAAAAEGAGAEADSRLCLALLLVHTARRLHECARIERPSGEMHLLAYALGISYYSLLPAAALAGCAGGGRPAGPASALWAAARRALAVSVYAWASLHQHRCHRILAELRAPLPVPRALGARARYRVPYGDWFAHVSCPHYLAELLLYASLLAAKPRDPTLGALLAWVVVGHAINARRAHGWYRAAFAHYPRSRTALIPGVF